MEKETVFGKILKEVPVKEGVKMISYKKLMKLQKSGEKFVLVDVLSADSYGKGHIEGAVSLPLDTINKDSAAAAIPQGSDVVVYCAGFKCPASTEGAKKLTDLGYKALDYKGGLKEWQEKGNSPVK